MLISQVSNPGVILERTLGMPPGGPKAIPITLDFSVANQYDLDYSNMTQRGFFDMVQSAWIDNSLSGSEFDLIVPAVGQTIKIAAGLQVYITVICPNPIKLSFVSNGGVVCQVILLNFPVRF